MLTKLKNDYKRLLKSKEFNNNGFLCGAFLICELNNLEKTDWQIDFYDNDSNKITTYIMNEYIQVVKNSEVLKKEDTEIEELNLEEIKVDFKDIKEMLKNILDKYNEEASRITIIIQKQNIPVWNIIYITKKFNLINIRVNAIDNSLLEEKNVSLVSFEK